MVDVILQKKQSDKKSSTTSKQKYVPPEIFRTDIYLHSDSPVMSSAISTPHVPAIPAVPSSELLAGSSGSTSGADKSGATSESGAAEKSTSSKVDDESSGKPVDKDSNNSVHSSQDVTTSPASPSDAHAQDSNKMTQISTTRSSTDCKPENTANANSNNDSISANQIQGSDATQVQ